MSYKKVPCLSFLKVWGYEVYVKGLLSDKLAPKSDKCLFIGYPKEGREYYFYNHNENKVFVARGVFLEKDFISKKSSGSNILLEEVREEQQTDVNQTTLEAEEHGFAIQARVSDAVEEEMHHVQEPFYNT